MSATLLISLLTGLCYLGSGLWLALGFFHGRRGWRRVGLALAIIAVPGHVLLVWQAMRTPLGWDVNFVNNLALAALIIVLVLLGSSLRSRMIEAGIIAFPGAALSVFLIWLAPLDPLVLGYLNRTLELHVFSSLLAYGLLSIAALTAILLAAQDHLLRHRRPLRQLELLPPLTVLERLLFRMIAVGWLLLSLSLATGLMFLDDLFAQHLAHKTILSLASWLLFGLLLLGRWWLGLRGRVAVRMTLIAMATLVLAYFGSKLVLEVILDRSWSSPISLETVAGHD